MGSVLSGNFVGRDIPGREILAGRFLAGRFLAGRFLAGRILAGRFLTGRFLAGRFLTGRFLAGRSDGHGLISFRPGDVRRQEAEFCLTPQGSGGGFGDREVKPAHKLGGLRRAPETAGWLGEAGSLGNGGLAGKRRVRSETAGWLGKCGLARRVAWKCGLARTGGFAWKCGLARTGGLARKRRVRSTRRVLTNPPQIEAVSNGCLPLYISDNTSRFFEDALPLRRFGARKISRSMKPAPVAQRSYFCCRTDVGETPAEELAAERNPAPALAHPRRGTTSAAAALASVSRRPP